MKPCYRIQFYQDSSILNHIIKREKPFRFGFVMISVGVKEKY